MKKSSFVVFSFLLAGIVYLFTSVPKDEELSAIQFSNPKSLPKNWAEKLAPEQLQKSTRAPATENINRDSKLFQRGQTVSLDDKRLKFSEPLPLSDSILARTKARITNVGDAYLSMVLEIDGITVELSGSRFRMLPSGDLEHTGGSWVALRRMPDAFPPIDLAEEAVSKQLSSELKVSTTALKFERKIWRMAPGPFFDPALEFRVPNQVGPRGIDRQVIYSISEGRVIRNSPLYRHRLPSTELSHGDSEL